MSRRAFIFLLILLGFSWVSDLRLTGSATHGSDIRDKRDGRKRKWDDGWEKIGKGHTAKSREIARGKQENDPKINSRKIKQDTEKCKKSQAADHMYTLQDNARKTIDRKDNAEDHQYGKADGINVAARLILLINGYAVIYSHSAAEE